MIQARLSFLLTGLLCTVIASLAIDARGWLELAEFQTLAHLASVEPQGHGHEDHADSHHHRHSPNEPEHEHPHSAWIVWNASVSTLAPEFHSLDFQRLEAPRMIFHHADEHLPSNSVLSSLLRPPIA